MKKPLTLAIFLLCYLFGMGQSCPNIDQDGDPELLTLPNTPNPIPLVDMIGVTAGRDWDQIYATGLENTYDFTQVASFARIFHEMQRDYAVEDGTSTDPEGVNTPRDNPNGPIINADLTNFSENFGMNDNYVATLRWYNHFNNTFGNDFNGFFFTLMTSPFGVRAFPVGWYTEDEWGGGADVNNPDVTTIRSNAKNYVKAFAKTYCPIPSDSDCPGADEDFCPCMVNGLEIGNEPWGYYNGDTYKAIVEGIFDGLDEYYGTGNWPFLVFPAAFQANEIGIPDNDPTLPLGSNYYSWRDYMGTRIPCEVKDKFAGVNVHPYSFEQNGFVLSAYPEKTGSPDADDGSEFQNIKNAVAWKNANMPGKTIIVSEFGWDSQIVGEPAQATYMVRASLIFARLGVYRASFYEALDSDDGLSLAPNKTGLFESCGVWKTGPTDRIPQPGGGKQSYFTLSKMRTLLGDKIFLNALSENDNGAYAYLFGDSDGKPTHMVAWLAKGFDNATPEFFDITLPNSLSLQLNNTSKFLDSDLTNGGTGANYNPTIQNGDGISGTVNMLLTAVPIVIPLNNPDNCTYSGDGTLICDNNNECTPGTPCDDGFACTEDDTYDENCVCSGTVVDTDNDGICDIEDNCPNTANQFQEDADLDGIGDVCDPDCTVEGQACDDLDPCTIDDMYNASCMCVGTFVDTDEDGVCDALDNCPDTPNTNQSDQDNDGVGDVCDLCTFPLGALCDDGDPCTVNDVYDANCNCVGTFEDTDEDGICDAEDNCPAVSNADQLDENGNMIGDACQDSIFTCPNDITVYVGEMIAGSAVSWTAPEFITDCTIGTPTVIQSVGPPPGGFFITDTRTTISYFAFDGCGALPSCSFTVTVLLQTCEFEDGTACDDGNACTINDQYQDCNCVGTFEDTDEDGICDAEDNCPDNANPTQIDADNDGIGDACDACNFLTGLPCDDNDACTTGDTYDLNCDCVGTPVADTDEDGVCDAEDNCPNNANPNQEDVDQDGIGDTCDNCNFAEGASCDDNDPCTANDVYDADCNCAGTLVEVCTNTTTVACDDGDPCTVNDMQTVDACDNSICIPCAGTPLPDTDEDGICDAEDNCPDNANPGQEDADFDGIGDVCDACSIIEGTPCDDADACTTNDMYDADCNCAGTPLPDTDEDGICDAEDNCPDNANPGQEDADIDGIGDVCDACSIVEGTPCDDADACTTNDMYDADCNCAGTPLPDTDEDGICDAEDNCPDTANPGQEDADIDGICLRCL